MLIGVSGGRSVKTLQKPCFNRTHHVWRFPFQRAFTNKTNFLLGQGSK
jgi:hypothetical protein